MPKLTLVPPPPQKVPPTPEQIAKRTTNRRRSPPGQPEKAVVTLRLLLPRLLVERLSARAIREDVPLAAVVEEILEGASAAK